jgi:predicted pyridoxine 5'-phosphate oxidase superfamily flavin-nucleotide-binding protein
MRRSVEDQRLAFVATVDADGTPNLSRRARSPSSTTIT